MQRQVVQQKFRWAAIFAMTAANTYLVLIVASVIAYGELTTALTMVAGGGALAMGTLAARTMVQ